MNLVKNQQDLVYFSHFPACNIQSRSSTNMFHMARVSKKVDFEVQKVVYLRSQIPFVRNGNCNSEKYKGFWVKGQRVARKKNENNWSN